MAWNVERKRHDADPWQVVKHAFPSVEAAAEKVRNLEGWQSFRWQYRIVPTVEQQPAPAALSAEMLGDAERKLLERARTILKRCEGPVSDYVDDHSSEDFHGLTLRRMLDWQREYAALQTEEDRG